MSRTGLSIFFNHSPAWAGTQIKVNRIVMLSILQLLIFSFASQKHSLM